MISLIRGMIRSIRFRFLFVLTPKHEAAFFTVHKTNTQVFELVFILAFKNASDLFHLALFLGWYNVSTKPETELKIDVFIQNAVM